MSVLMTCISLEGEIKRQFKNTKAIIKILFTLHLWPETPVFIGIPRGEEFLDLFTHSSPLFTFRNGNRCERQIEGLQISQN